MRVSQKVSFPISFLGEWEISGDKKSRWICLDIIPLFCHTVPELIQALVITYDEIFKALPVEGDVLLPKPFLNFSHHHTVCE
jgi:hypothetical protein